MSKYFAPPGLEEGRGRRRLQTFRPYGTSSNGFREAPPRWLMPSTHALKLHAARGEDFLGGAQAVVERLLEEGDAGEVCVREVDGAEGLLSCLTRAAPQEARARADHRVAPAHHVEPARERAYVPVRALKV